MASAGEAVTKGVVYGITHIEGGDIYMKRAVLNSTATTHPAANDNVPAAFGSGSERRAA